MILKNKLEILPIMANNLIMNLKLFLITSKRSLKILIMFQLLIKKAFYD